MNEFEKYYRDRTGKPPAVGPAAQAEAEREPTSRAGAAFRGFEQGLTLSHADSMAQPPGQDAGTLNDRRNAFILSQVSRGMSRPEAEAYWDATGGRTQRAAKAEAVSKSRSERDAAIKDQPGYYTAGEIGGNIALAAPALPYAPATTVGLLAASGTGGAIMGAVDAVGRGDGEADLVDIGVGGAVGGAGGLLGVPLAAVVKRAAKLFGKPFAAVFAKPRMFDPTTGDLTDAGRSQLRAMGADPDAISRQLAAAFEETAEQATRQGGGGGRLAVARSFGIPLTKGQSTGKIPLIAEEEAMRANARGTSAEAVMSAFDQRQNAAVRAAKDELVPNPANMDPVDAVESVVPRIKAVAAETKAAAGKAYDVFEEMGGGVSGPAVRQLNNSLTQSLKRESIPVGVDTPNAKAALAGVSEMLKGFERGSVPFERLERVRQRLGRLSRAATKGDKGMDQEAMRVITNQYDDWLEGAVDTAISDGTPAALAQVKKARRLWGAYLKTFAGKDGADNFIRKIVEDDLDPNQVVGWLFGASKNIGGNQSSIIAKRMRDILGADSPEFQALRQAAWQRMTMAGDKMRGTDDMSSTLGSFLSGKGKPLSRQLFTPDELQRIGEFRMALEVLRKPQKATNPSGSGYEAARAVQAATRAAAGSLGFATGGPGGAVVAQAVPGAVRNFRNGVAARAAAGGITGKAPSLGVALGGGAGVAKVGDEVIRQQLGLQGRSR